MIPSSLESKGFVQVHCLNPYEEQLFVNLKCSSNPLLPCHVTYLSIQELFEVPFQELTRRYSIFLKIHPSGVFLFPLVQSDNHLEEITGIQYIRGAMKSTSSRRKPSGP